MKQTTTRGQRRITLTALTSADSVNRHILPQATPPYAHLQAVRGTHNKPYPVPVHRYVGLSVAIIVRLHRHILLQSTPCPHRHPTIRTPQDKPHSTAIHR